MARNITHRRHKKGGNANLPYNAPLQGGRRRRHKMRGGGNGVYPYSSESTYGNYVNGDANSQYDRVFSQSGAYASVPGNAIIGAQGQNANMVGIPNPSSLSLIQSAGSRRRNRKVKHHTKKRRGGFLGHVINQAIVPFGLLGMQQSYRRNKNSNTSSKSRRRYK